jgi:hypothetical protein
MEVHHHSGSHAGKKNWKAYFFEFLMIFLAVTLGFFAESFREHLTERVKEKEFMRSMIEDLKADTAAINQATKGLTDVFKNVDTLLTCLKSDSPDPAIINRVLSKSFWTYTGYSYNNRTIQQLKNAGNFRLIHNKLVGDSILLYDNWMNTIILTQYTDLKNTMYAYKEVEAKVVPYKELKLSGGYESLGFDSSDFAHTYKPTLLSRDKELLSLYYNRLFIHEALGQIFIFNLKNSGSYATTLLQFIQKEYHLKPE